jgi:hypothetical protein
MTSLPKPENDSTEPLFVREGGVPYLPSSDKDPFEAWMELMEVVEALCPRWPDRPLNTGGEFRL